MEEYMSNREREEIKSDISDEAVSKATGKNWQDWFEILDAAGARSMDHKGIVAFLNQQHEISPWWQQSVTVVYEQNRGMRDKHETAQGYQMSRSKTIDVPVDRLYQAWESEMERERWLPDQNLTIRKATPAKSIRITWEDGSNLEVYFYPKGEAKSQVTVQHSKLATQGDVDRLKGFWGEALDRLKNHLDE
jgi:hypothetical protein